ncbi:MAG TPA: ROK family protein [Terriglobales bacterium]|nr:ROK family protein [Terriglobales bacterium]
MAALKSEGLLLGLDIGGTRIKAACVDESGAIIHARHVNTPATLEGFRPAVQELLRELIPPQVTIQAVGVGCKGIINPETTRVEVLPGTMRYLEGQVLAEIVAPALPAGVSVAADNDARVALAGEVAWGAARACRDAVMLTLGTGVGGGILADGRILRGASGAAGHLGHLSVDPDGPICICGNRGCIETLFSARTIESEAFAAIHRGVDSRLLAFGSRLPTCAEVFDLARQGDAVAADIVRRGARSLGAALAGLAHALDPELIILGGQISEAGDILLDPVREEVHWRTRCLLRRDVPVVRSKLVDPSGVIGAAALALQTRMGSPQRR